MEENCCKRVEKKVLGCGMISIRTMLFLAFICFHVVAVAADTNSKDYAVLMSLKSEWGNLPKSWTGGDPCGGGWDGITCKNSRIITITLSSMGVTGQLTGDLVFLSELQILDLSYNKGMTGSLPQNIGQLSKLTSLILVGCGFSGTIPDSIGSLRQLVYLSLNANKFTGEVPASIGNLKKLYFLDLSDNKLTGSIPVSSGTRPGLDLLVKTKHFHFGINKLSGPIPPGLFHSDMELIHVLFDNNNLTGSIPSTLVLVQTLQSVRFDRNSLSGPLPTNLSSLINVNELFLSNNEFNGPVPDLTGMNNLNSVDLSNNSFAATDIPEWLSSIQSLTTVTMERTGLEGQLPEKFFSLPQLQTVVLKNNRINGTLDIGNSNSSQLQLIDLENNSIDAFTFEPGHTFTLKLANNPFCQQEGGNSPYCNNQNQDGSSYSNPLICVPRPCSSGQTSSPTCKCAYPYTGILFLRSSAFSVTSRNDFDDLQKSLLVSLVNMGLPIDSVSLSDVSMNLLGYLNMRLSFFPDGQNYFNRTGVLSIGFVLSNQTYKPLEKGFGPYLFIGDIYQYFEGENKSTHKGLIVGVAATGSVLLLLLLCAGGYACYQKKRAENAKQHANPFVSWDSLGNGGDIPKLKGARFFSFQELQKCTNYFSEGNIIGSGGYGKVYKGILTDGQIVAIKRSQEGSMQGSREFKNEIELLSRVHHKNLVNLIGFCFDQGQQMLVYEFIPNGSLMDSISGKSGVKLDWKRRLMVVLGSARGLQYLHELANPPIIHRDIKSNNILLDERLNAKVADFGLSKLFGDTGKGYVTTQVKGTMGYLDPEYFMTNQLTEKSDVFSFGVVMLEMATGRRPIQQGKYIVREIRNSMDRTKDLYNLNEVMDPELLSSTTMLPGFEKFVDLALKCAEDSGADRPTMGEVVKEIENIVKLAGMNPNADSAPSSLSYEGSSAGNFHHPYSDDSLFQYSGSIPSKN